jgi:hypothetical protein
MEDVEKKTFLPHPALFLPTLSDSTVATRHHVSQGTRKIARRGERGLLLVTEGVLTVSEWKYRKTKMVFSFERYR